MEKRIIHVDISSLEEMGQQFIAAWERAKRGEPVESYHGVGFETLETLLNTLTPKRWALLSYLRSHGPMTVYALAKALGRHYKNVHSDVKVLAELDLITRTDDGRIEVPWDEIEAHVRLAAA
jgi:predicted transcriptional regulator